MTAPLSVERLKVLVNYDPGTGVFTRLDGKTKPLGVVNNYGYLKLHIGGFSVYAARAAWLLIHGSLPQIVDHIDHDPLNNQIVNLRACTVRENVRYQLLHRDNVSGFKGVSWVPHRKRWRARIVVGRENKHLGAHFTDIRDAARAYDAAALRFYGEFAITNESLGLL